MDKTIVEIDGIDGSGKSSLINLLNESPIKSNFLFKDRGLMTQLSLLHHSKLPPSIPTNVIYIILDVDIIEAFSRIERRCNEKFTRSDIFETLKWLHYFRFVMRMLASKYSTYLIDTSSMSLKEVFSIVTHILLNEEKYQEFFKVPNPDTISESDFTNLKTIVEGESKIIKEWTNKKWHLVKFKPTVYSHTNQCGGIVEGTDKERMRMTRETLFLFWLNEINHAYVYVGEKYILTRALSNTFNIKMGEVPDITDIEVIVKNCYCGTDKHRYCRLHERISRTGKPICLNDPDSEYLEYTEPYVRFDLRNPNHVYKLINFKQNFVSNDLSKDRNQKFVKEFYDEVNDLKYPNEDKIKKILYEYFNDKTEMMFQMIMKQYVKIEPWGDYCLSDMLANKFIDVDKAKLLALKIQKIMTEHFINMKLYFIDFCLMLCSSGIEVYGEFSQDCIRCDKIYDGESLSKDVWRAGGSVPDKSLVLQRYNEMSNLIEIYTAKLIETEMEKLKETK
jgi:hypothetical protein